MIRGRVMVGQGTDFDTILHHEALTRCKQQTDIMYQYRLYNKQQQL